jgi:sugar phosphate isomerase/epimerase
MQYQVAIISLGLDPVVYLEKYPGRFISMHLMDWSTADKKMVPVGSGAIDWKKIFAAAKKGGVKNYFVEMNMDALKASYPFLHNLKT